MAIIYQEHRLDLDMSCLCAEHLSWRTGPMGHPTLFRAGCVCGAYWRASFAFTRKGYEVTAHYGRGFDFDVEQAAAYKLYAFAENEEEKEAARQQIQQSIQVAYDAYREKVLTPQ